jgi:hypothetical protein
MTRLIGVLPGALFLTTSPVSIEPASHGEYKSKKVTGPAISYLPVRRT